ncbi:MAG: ABC transporter substrate-binding protein [Desulfobacterales bacterium]|nr:ABC transporter substrate-binding protein [Desulfobacterales bacterium]
MRIDRTIIVVSVLFFMFFPGFAAASEGPVLRLGILPVIDTLPLIVANEKELFAEEGIKVKILTFNSALERDAAIKGRALDGCFGDLLNTILLNASGEDLRVVTTAYHTSSDQRMFTLLSSPNSGITDISRVRDVPVAISKASIIEYFLDRIAEAEKIQAQYIKKIEIRQIPIRYQMLMDNSVRLALLPEPMASKAIAGGARLVADDRKLDTTATILAVKCSFLVQHPVFCERFLKAYDRSIRMINADPEAFKDLLVSKTRFPQSLRDTYRLHFFPTPGLPSEDDVLSVIRWLTAGGLLAADIEYENVVWRDASK